VRAAYRSEPEWDAALAAGLAELMRILVEHPHTACTCFVEMRHVGAPAAEPLRAAGEMCIGAMRQALSERPGAQPVGDIALSMGVGGLNTVIRDRLIAGEPADLQRNLPEIAAALLEPLAGAEAARAVAARLESGDHAPAAHAI
jgi:hypothetical protein